MHIECTSAECAFNARLSRPHYYYNCSVTAGLYNEDIRLTLHSLAKLSMVFSAFHSWKAFVLAVQIWANLVTS